MSNGHRPRGVRFWALSGLLVLVVALFPCGVVTNVDGLARYAQTKALLFHLNTLSIPPDLAHIPDGEIIDGILSSPNGQLYSKYGIGEPILWLVPASLAWVGHKVTGVYFDVLAGFFISFVNPLIVVLMAWSMLWILKQLEVEERARWWTVGFYILGTSILSLANSSFSEPLAGFLLLWACALPIVRPSAKSAAIAGALVSCCALTKPEMALLALCLIPLFLAPGRRRWIVPFWAMAAVGPVIMGIMNLVCRGSVTRFSYGSEVSQFHAPWQNMLQQFTGVDYNILIFNPALVLGVIGWIVFKRHPRWRPLALTTAAIWLVYAPFYMSWWAWGGLWGFGARFIAWFVPLTVLPSGAALAWLFANARRTRWAGALAAVCVAGIVVLVPLQIAGASIKDEQATEVKMVTGRTEAWTHLQLLAIKLHRGLRGPETYHKSDFVTLQPGEADSLMDFRSKRTFQYLDHWWALYLANKTRYGKVL